MPSSQKNFIPPFLLLGKKRHQWGPDNMNTRLSMRGFCIKLKDVTVIWISHFLLFRFLVLYQILSTYQVILASPGWRIHTSGLLFMKRNQIKTSVALATESSGYVWSRTPIVLTHKARLWTDWLFLCIWQLPRTKELVIGQWSRLVHALVVLKPLFWQFLTCFWQFLTLFWQTDRPTNEVRYRSSRPGA